MTSTEEPTVDHPTPTPCSLFFPLYFPATVERRISGRTCYAYDRSALPELTMESPRKAEALGMVPSVQNQPLLRLPCRQAGGNPLEAGLQMVMEPRCTRWIVPVLYSVVFLQLLLVSRASFPPNATGECVLDFSEYPYSPSGDCLVNDDSLVKAWESVLTTRCCQDALATLSQSLAVQANRTSGGIFLDKHDWDGCNTDFHPQRNVSITSCDFGDLYHGSSACSSLDLTSFRRNYSDLYGPAVGNCSRIAASGSFDDECTGCVGAVKEMRDGVIRHLNMEGNSTEELVCGVAAVVAVAAYEINDARWIRDLYACLRALSTEEGNVLSKVKYIIPKAILATAAATMGFIVVILLIKYVTKKPDKPVEGKVISTWSGLYRFSKAEIEKAINHGNQKVSLGSGSAGRVYQGVLPSGQLVAIKHIFKGAMSDSFMREVEEHSRIRHPNLVCLFGCCIEEEEKYLVYEYCSNGNLAHNLLRSDNVLPWDKRVKILRDCALSLRFLHHHPDGCIVHRDIKLTNILLTENVEPKLSDFGLAKMIGIDETKVFTDVRGTIGYMDPEYMTNAKLTCASDIYSFGIVVLQLLSGRKVIELNIDARDILTKKAKDVAQRKRPLEDFVDPRLEGDVNLVDFDAILQVAVLCVASSSKGRPSSDDLYHELDRIWKNTQANMSTKERSELNSTSAPQPKSVEVFEV